MLERQLGYGIALGSFSCGATPSEYLDRLDLQNLIFHDDIRLERVVANGGKPIIITSQPFTMGLMATAAPAKAPVPARITVDPMAGNTSMPSDDFNSLAAGLSSADQLRIALQGQCSDFGRVTIPLRWGTVWFLDKELTPATL